MKTFFAAIALTFALPAAANAQAAQSGTHADHQKMDHSKMDHGKMGQGADHKGCCDQKNADGTAKPCCKEKDAKKASCCDKQAHKSHEGQAKQ